MCGIAGAIGIDPTTGEALIGRMLARLVHRGPDDGGWEFVSRQEPVALLGQRRLAIIDLSPAGHQPMLDRETGNWITFNGEIYNYRELRAELEARGVACRTQTDTEVILRAYATWGVECVRRLRGIFAFGIWDVRARRLVLARDQLGVKPLYYWAGGGTLLFASEVRALLATGLIERRLDPRALRSYLAYGSVQEPYSLVAGIGSLPPGATMIWQDGRSETRRYWQLPSAASVAAAPPRDVLEQVGARLAEAVRIQMVADVPLGAFLSGGIDSTAIAALMQRAATQRVKTFSIVFDEKTHDEREFSQLAARRLGTEHTELLLRGDLVRRTLPQALAAFDQPSLDGLNTYFVSKITREAGLTVALSGVGGDELFGGYDGFRRPLFLEKWGRRSRMVPGFARRAGALALRTLAPTEAGRRLADLLDTERDPFFVSRQVFGPAQVAALLAPGVAGADWTPTTFAALESETAGYDPVNRISAFELQTYMLSTLLRDTDQMSMAHALEVRVPLLDHELVEYLFTLPGSCKLSPEHPKPLLTQSLGDALPRECVYRTKRGFELPFAAWFAESLHEEMRASFTGDAGAADPFAAAALAGLWRQFESGRIRWSRLWGIFVLRHWLAEHKIAA